MPTLFCRVDPAAVAQREGLKTTTGSQSPDRCWVDETVGSEQYATRRQSDRRRGPPLRLDRYPAPATGSATSDPRRRLGGAVCAGSALHARARGANLPVIAHDAPIEEFAARTRPRSRFQAGRRRWLTRRRSNAQPAIPRARRPRVRHQHCGFQAMAQALGGTVANTGRARIRRTMLLLLGRHPARRSRRDAAGVDEPTTTRSARVARRLRCHGFRPRGAGRGLRESRRREAASNTTRVLHSPTARKILTLPLRDRRHDVDHRQHRQNRSSPRCANRSATTGWPSATCPAGGFPRWRLRWCSAPSATG